VIALELDDVGALPRDWPSLDHPVALPMRAVLIIAGFLPVTLIAVSTFDIVGLRALAGYVLAPVIVTVAYLVIRRRVVSTMVRKAVGAGLVATALYDLVRFSFLGTGLMSHDPIPHIGVALGLHPAWVFGYLWRYLGNGGGLAVAFSALGLRGIRGGVLYGLFVCSGLLALLFVCPNAQTALFPLTWVTVLMATVGHAVYGAVLGAIAERDGCRQGHLPSAGSTGLTSTIGVPSSASRLWTRTLKPSIATIRTRCRPIGFGLSGDRVLKTPVSGLLGSLRGRVTSTSRRDRSSQVSTSISDPTTKSRMASAMSSSKTSTASGDPSSPCLGAVSRSTSGDSTQPTGRTSNDGVIDCGPWCELSCTGDGVRGWR
jgi:hypothetical protein